MQGACRRADPAPRAADPPGAAQRARGACLRVLVVEDDGPVREHAARLMRALGHAVREAGAGTEALQLLADDPGCDLLFSDVVMPDMGGGELAEAARRRLPGLGIVFVTGHHEDPVVERMRREGSAVVLTKPYRCGAVAEAVRMAVDGRAAS
ncbi:response regulator [Muricoccus vinaceus]|uniref:Response regulator n=1 Tax=Muricoccus vinaceus TaxID=424704 RepID=A0ABV6INE0_9PROT